MKVLRGGRLFMPAVTINYWAVLVSALASMVLGFIWYSKPVFGKLWMREAGKTEEEAKKGAGTAYFGMVILALVLSYVMAHFVDYTNADTFALGVTTGFWTWLGFAFTTMGGMYLFEGRSSKLFWINTGFHLIEFMAIGAILAMWV